MNSSVATAPTVNLIKREREFFVMGGSEPGDYEVWHIEDAPADPFESQDRWEILRGEAYDAFGGVETIWAVSQAHAAGIARRDCL